MLIHAWTFDVGLSVTSVTSVSDYLDACATRVEQSYDAGADIVLFPEYTWAGLEPHLPRSPTDSLRQLADAFWQNLWPSLQQRLTRPGKAAILGTAPYWDGQRLLNRCPIVLPSGPLFQDKLYLTPWESTFSPGDTLHTFHHLGKKCAVVICLDIEIPELSAALRGQGIDLLLVPSATESVLGVERVNRCASARAVELGCSVVVSHLVGSSSTTLIDENVGLLAHYLPSQSFTRNRVRESQSPVYHSGFHLAEFRLPPAYAERLKTGQCETNPALLRPATTPTLTHHTP
jgi:predicted amidohydrolase